MQNQFKTEEGRRLAPSFFYTLVGLFVVGFVLWFAGYRLLPSLTDGSPETHGFIALIAALGIQTLLAVVLLARGGLLRWRAVDPHGLHRAWLMLAAVWSGAMLAYYFLVYSQNLNITLSVALIFMMAMLGSLLLMVLSWELTLYLFIGVLTTIVSYATFMVANQLLNGGVDVVDPTKQSLWERLNWFPPQAISFSCAMLFAYPMNRKYVFNSNGPVMKEFIQFVSSRLVMTLIFEIAVFGLMHNILRMNRDLTKILTSFLVTVANYLVSKLYIFKRHPELERREDIPPHELDEESH